MTAWMLISAIAAAGAGAGAGADEGPRLVSVRRIWDGGAHNAFTDLAFRNGRHHCAFREGAGHVSPDGAIRILTSDDGETWRSSGLLRREGEDLRDPKIVAGPGGRLTILAAAATPGGKVRHQSLIWTSEDGDAWEGPIAVGDPDVWMWRLAWNPSTGKAHAIGYRTAGDDFFVRWYESADGIRFVATNPTLSRDGYVNESGLIFQPDGEAVALVRRDERAGSSAGTGALLGRGKPPYGASDWTWKDLGTRVGGPHLLRLPDGRIVAATRLYDKGSYTALSFLDPEAGTLTKFLDLPSSGDCSYPGMVWDEGSRLLRVSYYSSHEGKTSIYLAVVAIP